eukprot:CAMPEP_0194067632 /NCGR_PEP_ID=MMETSP0009_2-20130614/86658_1 /TAXON_ID=210454 /ORGANISM="Grammatophora oceanica, Strain CCMP 410" /LENGTH=606 /DNA_ID=CAMNT_0038720665 /DNA_START=182 /DNA_END=2002 /DNA_ORIENTATION=-
MLDGNDNLTPGKGMLLDQMKAGNLRSENRGSSPLEIALRDSIGGLRKKGRWNVEGKNQRSNSTHPTQMELGKEDFFGLSPTQHPWRNLSVRTDPVPGNCRHSFANRYGSTYLSCGRLIHKLISENMSSVEEAAEFVARDHPKGCPWCSPNRGKGSHFPYFRYDQVAPPIYASTTHFLRSVPEEWRVPDSGFQDLTKYMNQSAHKTPDRRYLYEFNPSIIALPPHHRPRPTLETEDTPIVYLASYRLSSRESYVGRELIKFMEKDEHPRDLLGLAFLRTDLSIAQDVVVSLQQLRSIMEDARLFLLNDTVYIGTRDRLIALHVETADDYPSQSSFPHKLENVFASPLAVTALHRFRTCALDSPNIKNVNYFIDEDDGSVIAELWPSNPHEVVPISLDMQPNCVGVQADLERDLIVDSKTPQPNFATVEELNFPAMRPKVPLLTPRPRGTACCVSITHGGRRLLVGVSHDKTPYSQIRAKLSDFQPNHFLSQFYAFEAKSPYSVVARSGYFCLGFPSVDTDGRQGYLPPNLIHNTEWDKLRLQEAFDCPKIHFVSGMTEAVDDSNMMILAYGVNDFLSRFVKVGKGDIASLLFDRDLENVRARYNASN